jgi:thymidylate synthase
MKAYLDIVEDILTNGKWKGNRTGIRTLMLPSRNFQHNMNDGFPLLTTRKLPIRSTLVELEGFINGVSSKKWYQDRGCKYWDYWANPEKVSNTIWKIAEKNSIENNISFEDALNLIDRKQYQLIEDDLGPIYGVQWRRWNEVYNEDDDGILVGIDQLKSLIERLKNNPDDRRLLVSAWNPQQLDIMALPPCHLLFQIHYVDGTLSLEWYQRSVDLTCGFSQNIASYATLLLLLCKETGFKPWLLTGRLGDAHIYENHIENAKIQLLREPRELPTMEITSPNGEFDIFKWTHKDVKLSNYNPHPKLQFDVAV